MQSPRNLFWRHARGSLQGQNFRCLKPKERGFMWPRTKVYALAEVRCTAGQTGMFVRSWLVSSCQWTWDKRRPISYITHFCQWRRGETQINSLWNWLFLWYCLWLHVPQSKAEKRERECMAKKNCWYKKLLIITNNCKRSLREHYQLQNQGSGTQAYAPRWLESMWQFYLPCWHSVKTLKAH